MAIPLKDFRTYTQRTRNHSLQGFAGMCTKHERANRGGHHAISGGPPSTQECNRSGKYHHSLHLRCPWRHSSLFVRPVAYSDPLSGSWINALMKVMKGFGRTGPICPVLSNSDHTDCRGVSRQPSLRLRRTLSVCLLSFIVRSID
ncbi:hypothetical protein BCR39DRAFT_5376 [Naematelia encephala]|uniref:Uncharacterized protein n=1 Tax=Naematelia encephala TaxID=71784 RepID=A0A1Y2BKW1_9TREE|nr:hypothetical protein BCR39DRAFT_5376 [Naematelia encephala]